MKSCLNVTNIWILKDQGWEQIFLHYRSAMQSYLFGISGIHLRNFGMQSHIHMCSYFLSPVITCIDASGIIYVDLATYCMVSKCPHIVCKFHSFLSFNIHVFG